MLMLGDSKTGPRKVSLNSQARRILERQPRGDSGFVYPSPRNLSRPRSDHLRLWYRVRRDAGIEDVRLPDPRHTHPSHAVMNGVLVPVDSRMLGHSNALVSETRASKPRPKGGAGHRKNPKNLNDCTPASSAPLLFSFRIALARQSGAAAYRRAPVMNRMHRVCRVPHPGRRRSRVGCRYRGRKVPRNAGTGFGRTPSDLCTRGVAAPE